MIKKNFELCIMKSRVVLHIGFWLAFLMLNSVVKSLFPSSSDKDFSALEIFFRYFSIEAIFLPWQMIPFYALFYYILPIDVRKGILKAGIQFFVVLLLCVVCYRSLISPVNFHFYGDKIDFNAYSINRMFYTLLEILPGFALASAIKLYRNKIYSEQRELELKSQKQAIEIQLLKSQFNPHFLFNTLNNLYGLSKRNNAHASEYILRLSGIMRYIVEESKSPVVLLSSEIKLLEDYIDLEKLRYDERLTVTFEKDVQYNQHISPLLLITFVENAFKHGASEQAGQSFIHIKLKSNHQHIKFSIENSTSNSGMQENNGISNAKKQLSLIYNNRHQLDIDNKDNIFSVNLTLYP